jgi:predicted TIM-barrel fold metal-dependent hydrolase
MLDLMNRRQTLAALLGAVSAQGQPGKEQVVETHVHLFSADLKRFPGHANGPNVRPAPLEQYLQYAKQANIVHSTHVSAEPYQDDMRYLEHTLQHAPKGFLKGALVYDPIREDTPRRMEEIVRRHPNRILALRIHCTRGRNEPPTTSGPIRDRDLMHPTVKKVWRKAGELGIAIQAHIQPWFAPQVEKLASEFRDTRVIVDHFGHAGVGTLVKGPNGWSHAKAELGYRDPKEFDQVLRLAALPQVILKVSGLNYSSREPFPHRDLKPLARRAFDALGPDRMVWGSLGHSMADFEQKSAVFDANFDFLSAADRVKIRGATAKRLFFAEV